MKLVVVVRGGIVREVFATSYEADVEVIDLDVPEFMRTDGTTRSLMSRRPG